MYPPFIAPTITSHQWAPAEFNSHGVRTSELMLHPLLQPDTHNALGDDSHAIVDLLDPTFWPGRTTGPRLERTELSAIATYPPITTMHITNDHVPTWPIVLESSASVTDGGQRRPNNTVKVGDVLLAIHTGLQERITQNDWDLLTPKQQHRVARCYLRRCAYLGRKGASEEDNRTDGVKRIDYFGNNVRFEGLSDVEWMPGGGAVLAKMKLGLDGDG
ncbi:hypothetical protein BDV98DRAFT_575418 [Pterulicium gracile]|uniref:DUF6699 domain-containing protein n=1 Tax=Pterulicium gracile TaxID=1884261 RepID=A0A5C3Q4A7_9AGAR|nr:hypothetical protein BDV98DRAFT_575418 [Pterula gracilis]